MSPSRSDTSPADSPAALRRRLELRDRELERSEARFRAIIEANADAILVVDRAGSIRFANIAAVLLFGTPREALIGSLFGYPVIGGGTTEVDLWIDGAPRVAEMRVVRSEWDGEEAYIASLRDITLRKRQESDARKLVQAETARAESERASRRFRFLAEASAVLSSSLDINIMLDKLARLCVQEIADWAVVYDVDAEGRPRRLHVAHRKHELVRAAAELRELPIDPRGMHPILEVLRTRRSRIQEHLPEEALANMSTNPRELELARLLGVSSFMLVPMVARDRALGAITFVRSPESPAFDADELRLAEEVTARAALAADNARLYTEAKNANQTKADFLAVVSHDLRTPLTAIIGYADLLSMGVPEPLPSAGQERVQRIRAAAGHLVYLLNELLAFARLDAGHEHIRLVEVDVQKVIGDIRSVADPLAQQQRLSFTIDTPAEPIILETDPDKLRQILLNLVGNAIKYTVDGSVCMQVSEEPDFVWFRVRDTGPGISPRDQQKIFEPFWQLNPTQRSHGGGTGLGLSVVQRLTRLLGGRIEVQSTVGAGSQFSVALPRNGGQRGHPGNDYGDRVTR